MSGENAENDTGNFSQFIGNMQELEVCLAEAHAAKNDLKKHLENECAEITEVTRINQELQVKVQKQASELLELEKTNCDLQEDLQNKVAENVDLSERNRQLSDKLEAKKTLGVTSSKQTLELKEQLRLEQEKNKKNASENRQLSMELAILKEDLKDAENNIELKVQAELERTTEALLVKHQEQIKAMQSAYEEEKLRAYINAATDIKVAKTRTKFYFDETQDLCAKIKSLETSLANNKDETQKCMKDLEKMKSKLGKAKKEIDNINHEKNLLTRELKELEEKQIYEWAEYEKERNADLLMMKKKMEELEKIDKSKFFSKKRQSTRRELIQSVCTKLEVRLGASLE